MVLTNLYASALNLLAQGAINDPESPLVNPEARKDYTSTQIVGGLIFDVIVTLILLSWLFYVGVRNYGPPSQWFKRRTAHPDTA